MLDQPTTQKRPGRPRKYTEEQRANALRIYRTEGPRVAERETGISASQITRWAQALGIETTVTMQTRAAVEQVRAAAAERRSRIQGKLLETVEDLIDRIPQPHIDFKGKDAIEVTYPVAPASAVAAYMGAIATGLQEYRKEMGESGGKMTIDFNARIATLAANAGLPPELIEREVKQLITGDE